MGSIENSLENDERPMCSPSLGPWKISENYTELSVQVSLLQRSSVTNTSPVRTEESASVLSSRAVPLNHSNAVPEKKTTDPLSESNNY